ncbi:MAG TPA: hypothetical protein VEC02_04610 [Nitrososphaerales archaeon]|nr:hypothetical protein [Nitrososphaerales archaeon]
MSLKNRRGEYTWPATRAAGVELMTDRMSYARGDTVKVSLRFRIVGGLREAFHPDIWTVSWEDFDKILRLTIRMSVGVKRGLLTRKLAEVKKEVRKASFYWSRDPDLPYRIWAMIVPEDGGPPRIPSSVEDAQKEMLDVAKTFELPASDLGRGRHALVGEVYARWGRRSFIEKGEVSSKSRPLVVSVE